MTGGRPASPTGPHRLARCRARRARRGSAAFTLVELLVVIGIIAVLVGVLLPALSGARQTSRALVCASNVRQLVIASINYAQENHGHYPPAHFDFTTANRHRWHGTRPTNAKPFDFATSPLLPYLQSDRIKGCPDFEPSQAGFEASAGGYGYNNAYLGSSTADLGFTPAAINKPAKTAMVAKPSQKVAFADTAMAVAAAGGDALIEYSFVEAPLTPWGPASPSIHFRHRRGANVAWADGHVTRETFEWTYPTNAYGARNEPALLGFFGPRDNALFRRR